MSSASLEVDSDNENVNDVGNHIKVIRIISLCVIIFLIIRANINTYEQNENKDYIVEKIEEPYEVHVLINIGNEGREDIESLGIEYMGSNLFKFPEGMRFNKLDKFYNRHARYLDPHVDEYFVVKNDEILLSIIHYPGNKTIQKYSGPSFESFENLQQQEYKRIYSKIYEEGQFYISCRSIRLDDLLDVYENLLNEKSRKEVLPFPCVKK